MTTLEKHDALYTRHLIEGDDPEVVAIFCEHYKKMAHAIAEKYPAYFEAWVDSLHACIEGKEWAQFLTPKEAETIMAAMTPKAKWTIEEIEAACTEAGLICEKKPHWNLPALAAVMNMEASDHEKSNATLGLEADKETELTYMRAVEKLEDEDGRFNVRKYFVV